MADIRRSKQNKQASLQIKRPVQILVQMRFTTMTPTGLLRETSRRSPARILSMHCGASHPVAALRVLSRKSITQSPCPSRLPTRENWRSSGSPSSEGESVTFNKKSYSQRRTCPDTACDSADVISDRDATAAGGIPVNMDQALCRDHGSRPEQKSPSPQPRPVDATAAATRFGPDTGNAGMVLPDDAR